MYFIGTPAHQAPFRYTVLVGSHSLQEIRSTKAVAEYLGRLGCDVHTWRVGRAYAAPKLREIDGLWGGELAGHYYFKDFFYSDSGLLASMIVLRIVAALKKEGRTLHEAVSEIAAYQNSSSTATHAALTGQFSARTSRTAE